jgi:hypothetical protein
MTRDVIETAKLVNDCGPELPGEEKAPAAFWDNRSHRVIQLDLRPWMSQALQTHLPVRVGEMARN